MNRRLKLFHRGSWMESIVIYIFTVPIQTGGKNVSPSVHIKGAKVQIAPLKYRQSPYNNP